jgi:lipoprotein-anchoring transpeptidase ErfK/SrfK
MGSSKFSRSPRFRPSRYLFVLLAALLGIGAAVFLHDRRLHHRIATSLAALNGNGDTVRSPAFLDPKPAAMLSEASPSTRPALTTDPKRGANVTPGNTTAAPARPLQSPPRPVVTPAPAGTAAKLLADAEAKSETGDLAGARAVLNEPLVSGRLAEPDAQAVRHALMEINAKLVLSAKPYPSDPFEAPVMVESGMRLQKLANQYDITWPLICRVNGYEPTDAGARRIRAGHTIKLIKGPFCAVVNKGAFRMDLYLGGLPGEAGSTYVTSFPVGLGKDDSTPTGLWTVELHNKVRNPVYYSPRGEGVFKSEDPKNPLGGYWIGLKGEDGNAVGKNSYGIHGTIEPESIGRQSSMGCIRLGHDDIALAFDMLVEIKSRVLVQP